MKLFVCFEDALRPKDGQEFWLSQVTKDNLGSYLSMLNQYSEVYLYGISGFLGKINNHELYDDFIELASISHDEENPTNVMVKYTIVINIDFRIPGMFERGENPTYRMNGEALNVIEIDQTLTESNFETLVSPLSELEFMYFK